VDRLNGRLHLKAWAGCLLAAVAWPLLAHAHDAGLSTARVVLNDTSMELRVAFAPADVTALLPVRDRVSEWTVETVALHEPALRELGAMLYVVRAGGRRLPVTDEGVTLVTDDRLEFFFRYARPDRDVGAVEFEALNLGALPSTHREYFSAVNARRVEVVSQILKATEPVVTLPLFVSAATGPTEGDGVQVRVGEGAVGTFGGFFLLGVEHIWTGYDHLLFLFGLLLVCRTLRSVAVIITAFTVAHSLTLAVATLGWIHLSGAFVEPAIAASIIYVGVENLLRKGKEPHGRGWLTFGFGLVHGFGFASVLADLGVGRDGTGIVQPLLAFNLGVELGQLAVAAALLPLLMRLRRYPVVAAWALPASSMGIVLAGTWWLLERVWPA
jgi:hydrogenase/urease accessory protein HupE